MQKSRVTERHNRGTKRKLKSHPRPKKGAKRLFLPLVRLQFSLCAPIVPLRDATFFANDATSASHKNSKKHCLCPTSNRLYSISFVKTSALGGFPLSGTAVLTDCLKTPPKKNKKMGAPLAKLTRPAPRAGPRDTQWRAKRATVYAGSSHGTFFRPA